MHNKNIENEVLLLETRLTCAERDADEAELNELLTPDFSGLLVNGLQIDKTGFIAAFCKSGIVFKSLEIEDLQLQIDDSIAVVRGRSVFLLELNGNEIDGCGLFEDTWVKVSDIWKLKSAIVKPVN